MDYLAHAMLEAPYAVRIRSGANFRARRLLNLALGETARKTRPRPLYLLLRQTPFLLTWATTAGSVRLYVDGENTMGRGPSGTVWANSFPKSSGSNNDSRAHRKIRAVKSSRPAEKNGISAHTMALMGTLTGKIHGRAVNESDQSWGPCLPNTKPPAQVSPVFPLWFLLGNALQRGLESVYRLSALF